MRKIITYLSLLTTIGTAVAGPHHSADHFRGYYIGLHAGETLWDTVWVDRDTWIDNFNNDWALGSVVNRYDGFSWGVQGGYNWRCNTSLFGIEIDWSSTHISNISTYSPVAANTTLLTLDHELEWYGSIRGRLGVVADHLLLYITGGPAFARLNHSWSITAPGNNLEQASKDKTKWGGTGGIGGELAFSRHWSVKAEALYFAFPEDTTSFVSVAGAQTVHFDTHDSYWVARIGVNYAI